VRNQITAQQEPGRLGNRSSAPWRSRTSISHAIVMTDALNIYDGILKLKKMVLQRSAA